MIYISTTRTLKVTLLKPETLQEATTAITEDGAATATQPEVNPTPEEQATTTGVNPSEVKTRTTERPTTQETVSHSFAFIVTNKIMNKKSALPISEITNTVFLQKVRLIFLKRLTQHLTLRMRKMFKKFFSLKQNNHPPTIRFFTLECNESPHSHFPKSN